MTDRYAPGRRITLTEIERNYVINGPQLMQIAADISRLADCADLWNVDMLRRILREIARDAEKVLK
jgi:hypothetical protein